MPLKDWISITRDISQVIFFAAVGIVTVLTYLKAKKTLLQPIRTEVFKEQIKLFSDLLRLFAGKTEYELRADFALNKLLSVNICALYDYYGALFYDIEVERDERPYSMDKCPTSLLREDDERLSPANDPVLRDQTKPKSQADPRTKAAIWNQYTGARIYIPKEFSAKDEEFKRIIDSPLLPQKLADLLTDYLNLIHTQVQAVRPVLSECAREMPENYSNIDDWQKASTAWIHNRYIKNIQPLKLEEQAKQICTYLREYFTTDNLMD